ncbi:MAG: acyl-CoA thioesterase [Xanthomonadaceae bacterium]|jgi:acyl-CoA thioester hydrolase|nr:acyl-CoA thioesterase [Xanthomonadaceae bacterium]
MTQSAAAPKILARVPIPVRWGDMDAFGHVNNTRYLGYLEEARVQWLTTIPGSLQGHILPVIAAVHINYRHPIKWPNDLIVELFVDTLGSSSITVGHRIVSARDENLLYSDGHVVAVWMDIKTGKSTLLPEPIQAACR